MLLYIYYISWLDISLGNFSIKIPGIAVFAQEGSLAL